MPIYVYECKTCQKNFEIEQRISESPLTDCSCGNRGTLRRLIQPTAVMFKGSGFHINDYTAASHPNPNKPEKAAPTTSSAVGCSGEPASCGQCSV